MIYVSIDPGDKRCGVAEFDSEGIVLPGTNRILQGADELYAYLDGLPWKDVGFVVCEQFELQRWKAQQQSGSKMETSKRIGVIERECRRHSVELIMSRNTNMTMGFMYAGLPKPRGHVRDDLSAYVHGVYILQTKGIREAQI